MLKFALFLTCIINYARCAEENCDKLGVNLYEDLGCKPVIVPDKKCPVKFNCDPFVAKNNTCVFRNRQYNVGDEVDNDLTYDACKVGCRCIESFKQSVFNCAILDCPEWLGRRPPPNCHFKYELDKCCSVGEICPPFETCQVGGKTYDEGEKFTPPDTCLKCVCKKGLTDRLEPHFCKRQTCAAQIQHSRSLESYCAPGYFQSTLCCPSTWLCSESDDKIEQITEKEANPDLVCKYGEKNLNLGQGFVRTVEKYGQKRKMKCECILPPLLTCVQQQE